jgi:hypothetical protein
MPCGNYPILFNSFASILGYNIITLEQVSFIALEIESIAF